MHLSVNQQFRCQGIARADTAVRPYAENLVSTAQAIFVTNTHHARAGTEACPYESLYQVRFAIGKRQSTVINKPINAQRGGMLSGRAASRTGQLLDTASQHTFGGWQGGHHPRWQIHVTASRNHYTRHRGWSTHVTTRRYRKAQPNPLGIRISRNIRRPRRECEASTAQA